MSGIKTLAIVAALLTSASSLAMTQAPGNTPPGNTGTNAAASGGPGTHTGAMRSGSQANSHKVYKNQNGYQPGRQ